jgi:putative peptide zinc metalloprotease protein
MNAPGRRCRRWWPRLIALGGLLLLTSSTTTTIVAQAPATATATPVVPSSAPPPETRTMPGGVDDPAYPEDDGITRSDAGVFDFDVGGHGGVSNMVRIRNRQDERFRIRGNVELNRMHGWRVTPRNFAAAVATCTDCRTIVLAFQLNMYERTATHVAPENVAVALNVECTRCYTVAIALQYNVPVEDPNATPEDVAELVEEMDRELHRIHNDKKVDLAEAEATIDGVTARFISLGERLTRQRSEATEQNSLTSTPVPPSAAGSPVPNGGTPVPSATSTEPAATPPDSPADTATSTPTPSPTSAP